MHASDLTETKTVSLMSESKKLYIETISRMYFKQVILTDVPAMHKGKRQGEYVTDFHKLMNVVPRSVL